MKKQIRRAMLCTVCMMLMGVVSLTGVTYAWFSESDSADVNGLSVEVVASEGGVYVSTDGYDPESYGTNITISPAETKYNPASTAGVLDADGNLKFFKGTLDSPNDPTIKVYEIAPGENAGYYIKQDVYFDNTSGGADITISLDGTVIKPTAFENKPTHYAVRVAVVTHSSLTQEQFNAGGQFVNTSSDTVQIYENDATSHTTQGTIEYKKIESEATSESKFDYYALNSATTTAENEAGGTPRLSKTNTKLTKMTTVSNAADVKFTVPANSYLKTTLYVWLEGQDADCQNNISGNTFEAAIKFTLS